MLGFVENEEEFSEFSEIVANGSSSQFIKLFDSYTYIKVIDDPQAITSPTVASTPKVFKESPKEAEEASYPSFMDIVRKIRCSLYSENDVCLSRDPPQHTKAWLDDLQDIVDKLPQNKSKIKPVNKWLYYTHLKVAEFKRSTFTKVESIEQMFKHGQIRGQGKKRCLKQGLFGSLKGTDTCPNMLNVLLDQLIERKIIVTEFIEKVKEAKISKVNEEQCCSGCINKQQELDNKNKKIDLLQTKVSELERKLKVYQTKPTAVVPPSPCSMPNNTSMTKKMMPRTLDLFSGTHHAQQQSPQRAVQVNGRRGRKRKLVTSNDISPKTRMNSAHAVKTLFKEETIEVDNFISVVYNNRVFVGRVMKIERMSLVVQFLKNVPNIRNPSSKLNPNDIQHVDTAFVISRVAVFESKDGVFETDLSSYQQAVDFAENYSFSN